MLVRKRNKHKRGVMKVDKRAAVFVVGFAVIGVILLSQSFAATSGPVSVEPESGTLSGQATVANDSNASGGKLVQFGAGGGSTSGDITLPARAAFYYPWYPATWTVNGAHVKYQPTLGYYDSSSQSVVDSHIQAMQYAGIKVAIASWWGPNTQSETVRIPLILQRTTALNTGLKWALYYESEGFGDPSVAQLQSELQYIKSNYTTSSSYATIGGKPVLFVYNASANDNSCSLADKWAQANAGIGFYINLKVFTGYKTCANQPSSWHQYSPAVAVDSQAGYSYAISPGFWRADEAAPRLARDPARWTQNVNDMVASNAPWQLVTTFNEWGEGTAVEGAQDWSSSSGQGTYLDALRNRQ